MHKELLQRYFKNQCSEAEKQQVQKWLAHPDNKELAEEYLSHIWREESGKKSLLKVDYAYLWSKILFRIDINVFSRNHHKNANTKVYPLAIASAISLAIIVSAFFLLFNSGTITISTGYAESRTIDLPDGTSIKLNNNSRLRYEKDFGENGSREVWLEGEAYFEIAHLPVNSRFIVNTNNLEVEVLGTSFNLIDREEKVELVLNSGKVKLNEKKQENSLYMNPGELVAMQNNKLVKKKVNAELHTSWRYNLLNFQQTSLHEIGKMINYNFGKQVIFSDQEIAGLQFTGSNPADDLELLLETLEISFNLIIKQKGDKIYIRKNY
ncbi:MAG: FecR family protein [Cyclobacteriaceae bacterium]